jgi:hypothetical protein
MINHMTPSTAASRLPSGGAVRLSHSREFKRGEKWVNADFWLPHFHPITAIEPDKPTEPTHPSALHVFL